MLSDAIADTSSGYVATIQCDYPNYNTAYTGSCGDYTHSTVYASDNFPLWNVTIGSCFFFDCGGSPTHWNASIPTGWFTYTTGIMTVTVLKIGAVFALIAIPLFLPALVSDLWFMWAINIPMYIIVGVCTYKLVLPFA